MWLGPKKRDTISQRGLRDEKAMLFEGTDFGDAKLLSVSEVERLRAIENREELLDELDKFHKAGYDEVILYQCLPCHCGFCISQSGLGCDGEPWSSWVLAQERKNISA